jgi:RNA recognition motif-containing protein
VVGPVLFLICRVPIDFPDPPPTVRLLTPKTSPTVATRPSRKSKGCAFLEFSHHNALQQALKLHQSELDGRMINVELTAGGGGRSENRLTKVRQRNKALLGQRVRVPRGATVDAMPIFSTRELAPRNKTQIPHRVCQKSLRGTRPHQE